MADDDVICLSSDTEEEVEEVGKHQIASMRDDLKQLRNFTSKKNSNSPAMYTIPCSSSSENKNARNGHGLTSKSEVPETIDLDDESCSDYEFETCHGVLLKNGEKPDSSIIDRDDEIQVLDEGDGGEEDNEHNADNEQGESSDVEEVVEDEDELEEITHEECARNTNQALLDLVTEIRGRKYKDCPPDSCDTLERKLTKLFKRIQGVSIAAHLKLQEEIREIKKRIIVTSAVWTSLKPLKSVMSSPAMVEQLTCSDQSEIRKQKRLLEERKLIEKFEKKLLKAQREIKKLEEQEVDWDDENNDHNSAYCLEDRYKERIVNLYYKLCDLTKCSHLTGRPVQLRINLKKHNAGSGYDAIDAEIEKFLNKQGYMLNVPDFTDVLSKVTEVNQENSLGLGGDVVFKLAEKLFRSIVQIIKRRRERDFKMTMIAYLPRRGGAGGQGDLTDDDYNEHEMSSLEDPADDDLELKAKLEENKKLMKSEAEILDTFANAQGKLKNEEDDDATSTSQAGPANDNQDSETEDPDEDNEDDDEDYAKKADHQYVELTEDEDEEPETVRCPVTTILNSEGNEKDVSDDSDVEIDEANASKAIIGSDVTESDNNSVDKVKDVRKRSAEPSSDLAPNSPSQDDGGDAPPTKKARSADENSNEANALNQASTPEITQNETSDDLPVI